MFCGLEFAVTAESCSDPCRYLIQVTSGVWGTDTVPHRACSCTHLKYLCTHLSIHITIFLSLSLSFQCYLISSWLSLHFFHRINIFPLRMCSPSLGFSLFTPCHFPLPPPDPLPSPSHCQFALCTQHNTDPFKWDDFH